jgi:uncharacterized Zn finger protein (UPF0148 family)
MSELLRSGATMTSEHCPECNTPLFRVRGQLMCPKCNKPVVVVKEGEEENTAISFSVLGSLENTLMFKLDESSKSLREAKNLDEERELGNLLNIWLEAIERLKRVQKGFSSATPPPTYKQV